MILGAVGRPKRQVRGIHGGTETPWSAAPWMEARLHEAGYPAAVDVVTEAACQGQGVAAAPNDSARGSSFRALPIMGARGAVENSFRYSIDYVRCWMHEGRYCKNAPRYSGRTAAHCDILCWDSGTTFAPKVRVGAAWCARCSAQHNSPASRGSELRMAQPRFWGMALTPVSFSGFATPPTRL